MSHEGQRGRKSKKRGHHGTCTYCGVIHTKKKPSCRGHAVRKKAG